MRKALIFVCAFAVSSLVIYSVYYYGRINKLTSGIVAFASELPKTAFSPKYPKHFSDTSYIGNAGLSSAINDSLSTDFSLPPTENYLTGNGIYNKAFLEEMNIGISNKFPNHPPIGFGNLQEGDKVLFSYFFKNVILPKSFFPAVNTIDVDGKHFRALAYMPEKKEESIAFAMGENNTRIYIPIDNSSQYFIISKHKFDFNNGNFIDKNGFILDPMNVAANQKSIIFPEIDFNIIKYWKPEDAYFIPNAKQYKQLEERAKIKLTSINREPVLPKNAIELKPPFYMYLYKKGTQKPYFALYIAGTELLLPARK
ncbi:MAG: hypothetical protein EOP53_06620 [Sphingobacteriales bacterium]|nr:MAG: hypothetical protein EOP53_06620 [Sphingobacteriales bacterium]